MPKKLRRLESEVRAPRELLEILSFQRPSGSRAEAEFVKRFLLPLGVSTDPIGNWIGRIGTAPVLWSSHIDTVHRRAGRQNVRVDAGVVRLSRDSGSSCLGADDGAGVWLMCEMWRAGVSGLYVWHHGEEKGGIGSSYLADAGRKLLDGVHMAIALDRGGKRSVITHQGMRCCSDAFAESLGRELGLGMQPDDSGLFTDTANYTECIGECTNVSVGYESAHSAREHLDLAHLLKLRDRLLTLDVGALDIQRQPGDEDDEQPTAWNWGDGWSWPQSNDRPERDEYRRMLEAIAEDPGAVARALIRWGITAEELETM